jgi:hypothetical protein
MINPSTVSDALLLYVPRGLEQELKCPRRHKKK